MRSHLSVSVVCVAAALSTGCRLAQDVLPRTHTTSVAPDGLTRAFVRQHLSPDPPDDHLYIVRPGERAQEVMALAPDADWSRAIVWSPDSRKVGFVVNDRQLAVYDARSFDLEAMLILVSDGSQEVRSVTLDQAGAVSFDVVKRALMDIPARDGGHMQVRAVSIGQYRPGSRIVKQERMLGRRTLTIRAARMSLRLRSPDNRPVPKSGWARLQTRDGRQARVPWTIGDDGTVRLAAFDAGPLAILEVGVPGNWRTTVLKDVVTTSPVDVTLPGD